MSLYGVLLGVPTQRAIAESYCWGPGCGKGLVGGITDEALGDILPCRVPAEECPCVERETDGPIGEVHGEPLVIRKLRTP